MLTPGLVSVAFGFYMHDGQWFAEIGKTSVWGLSPGELHPIRQALPSEGGISFDVFASAELLLPAGVFPGTDPLSALAKGILLWICRWHSRTGTKPHS